MKNTSPILVEAADRMIKLVVAAGLPERRRALPPWPIAGLSSHRAAANCAARILAIQRGEFQRLLRDARVDRMKRWRSIRSA
ncbi:hypothetical protein [Bradyrhizobium sp. HKCCYLS20291]|uniref:hypothetical protein n=1 Tax=Bradyrhizobium sp. HKCCYLS20291 TaxID=3420766 RepID=UPI003EB96CAF